MDRPAKHFYEFGSFRLDATERLLLRDGRPVPLKAKVFDLLLELVSKRGRVLMKEELMKQIWPDTFVEDHNLAVSISMLRKALGDDDNNRLYIETIPRRGYRFVASVREISDQVFAPDAEERRGSQARADDRTRTGATVKAIAVLPFELIGAESGEEEYLGLGITDALITRISNLSQIVVRPTSAVRKYAGGEADPVRAGRELSVASVLEGGIQRSGKRLRVTVQLVNVHDGATLWAEKFDEKFTNIFAVEDSISEQVAHSLTLTLSKEERKRLRKRYTDNTAAYQAYLKGRFLLGQRTAEALEKGIGYFKEAIRIDPDYALAYAGLADAYQFVACFNVVGPNEAASEAKRATLKALELDDSLAEAHISLAYQKQCREWDWSGAESEYKRAIQLNPNQPMARQHYSIYLRLFKRFDEAMAEIKKAQELDPFSSSINNSAGSHLYFARRYDAAVEQLSKVIELDPNYILAHYCLGLVYEQKGMLEAAIKTFQRAINLSGNVPEFHAGLGHAYALSGRRAEAQDILNALKELSKRRYVSPYDLATIHVGLGENDEAFGWLQKAYEERCVELVLINVDPRLDDLRKEPQFIDLMRRVGFSGDAAA